MRTMFSCLIVIALLFVRCTRPEATAGRPSKAVSQVDRPNPFSLEDGPIEPEISQCVHLTFDVRKTGAAFTHAAIDVRNQCGYPIAILTAPGEIRVRRSTDDRFPDQSLSTAANATFYVARKGVPLSPDMFWGDGGSIVYGLPRYASVPANGTVTVPIEGAERLTEGEPAIGSMALVTFVTPLSAYEAHVDPFDLALSVDTFNNRQLRTGSKREPFRMSRRVHEISGSVGF